VAELEIKPTSGQRYRSVAVIVVAIGLTGFLMLLFIGGGGDLLARRTTITTYMPDGTGLAGYSVVRLGGLPIGKVTSVAISGKLDPQRAIRVELRLVTRFLRNIPVDSQTNIGKDTLVGYPFIGINPGRSRVTLPENGVLESEPVVQADIRADQVRAMEDTFAQVDLLLAQIASANSAIGQFVNGSNEYDSLIREIADFDRTVQSFIAPQSQMGQAFFSSEAYDRIRSVAQSADLVLSSIQSGNGVAGQLFASDDQYLAAVRTLTNLRATLQDLNAGRGSAGVLLTDDTAYRNVRRMIASTDALLTSLNAGQGRAGELLRDPQLYESLTGALREIQTMLKDLNDSPKKHLRFKVFKGNTF
jgi:phospholipid/cholesterol/gamma-HCH transport system substrate-binding protein